MKVRIILLLFLILIFLSNQVFEIFGGKISFLYSYLDDILFFPIILTVTLIILQIKINRNFILSKQLILISVLFFSILLEIIYPKLSNRFTFDPIDIFVYGVGALFFYFSFNERDYVRFIKIKKKV